MILMKWLRITKGLQIIIRAYQPQKRERNLRVDIQNHRLIDRLPTTYIHSKVQSAICFLMSNLEEWSGYDVHAVVQITRSRSAFALSKSSNRAAE